MALLQELNEAPGGDSFANLYAKYDLLTQTINSILGGGTAGQYPSKVDGTDFNFVFTNPPVVKFKVVNIGPWDMDTTSAVNVAHGIADFSKIRMVQILINRDDSAQYASLEIRNPSTFADSGPAGTFFIQPTNMVLQRSSGGLFDATQFNDAVMNRGFVTIGYID